MSFDSIFQFQVGVGVDCSTVPNSRIRKRNSNPKSLGNVKRRWNSALVFSLSLSLFLFFCLLFWLL